jgi:chloride channel 3/4/5
LLRYSSFSSIDWLHDAIKDSVRFSRLRKRKSLRARVRLFLDKSLGWLIVTLVGFLTAIVAFLILRGEQWLFDVKEGYCHESWWKARRFCCPDSTEDIIEECSAWRTWSELLVRKGAIGEDFVEYISYSVIAVRLESFVLVIFETCSLGLPRYTIVYPHFVSYQFHNIRHAQGIRRSRAWLRGFPRTGKSDA